MKTMIISIIAVLASVAVSGQSLTLTVKRRGTCGGNSLCGYLFVQRELYEETSFRFSGGCERPYNDNTL